MSKSSVVEQLLAADDEERARLLQALSGRVGEAEVHALAERARATAQADPGESLRVAGIAAQVAALDGRRSRALADRARAVALRAQGRWSEALSAFEQGARDAEAAGDPLLAAQIPIAAVDALTQLGRYDEALALAADLEGRLRALSAEEDAAKVLANAGGVHFLRCDYNRAAACWERSLAYFEAQGQAVAAARLRMNLANVLTHLNRMPDALAMYDAARRELDEAGMRLLVAAVDGNIGYLKFQAGAHTEALRALQSALAAFQALALPMDVAKCEREIADVYRALNLVPEAQETYERVLPLFQSLEMPGEVARTRMGLADALAGRGRLSEALEMLRLAEEGFAQESNEVCTADARLCRAEWLQETDPKGARGEAEGAERVYRRRGMALAAAQARLVALETRVRGGEAPVGPLRRLARRVEEGRFLPLAWRVEATLARAHRNAGRERAAVLAFRRALDALESARALLPGEDFKIAYLKDKLSVYEELIALLLERGTSASLEEAFSIAERARSRALLELLTAPVEERAAEGGEAAELLRRLEDLRARLHWDYGRMGVPGVDPTRFPKADAGLPERVRALEAEYHRARRQLQVYQAEGGFRSASVPSVSRLQSLLREDETVLEFLTAGEEVLAFVVSPRRFRVVRNLTTRSEVARQIERLQFQWSKFRLGAGYAERHEARLLEQADEILRSLYGALLQPFEGLLESEKLLVVPHGALHSVPFHALRGEAGYALDRWEIAYAPSAAVFAACRERKEVECEESLLLAVPDPGIACVREEVAELQRLLPQSRAYVDGDATVAAVPRRGAFRYLHFATHAVFRSDNPLFSGIRLSDGWLVAEDLYRRRLACSLATLSACHTGVNALAPGDEVLGLTRGFLHAGARAVMVSLWSAHDAATAALMRACYGKLAGGGGRAAALRAAQQAVREEYPHPYHWAAFALVGER